MGSRFWPNRTRERQSSQNRHTGVKFSSKQENSALFRKIVQNCLFRSCGARFGQIAFVSVKVLKIVTVGWNSLQTGKQCGFYENCTKRIFQVMGSTFWPNRICERQSSQNRHTGLKFSLTRKTARFSWKLYKRLFSGHAEHVLAKSHFWAWKFLKSSHWPEILAKTRKQCALNENCTKRENSALFLKIVQNALFRPWEARFGQIAFLTVKVLKIVTLAWNSRENWKTVRFLWKLYKTVFSGHAEHVLAKSNFWAWKFLKSSHWPEILAKTGRQRAFQENCTKRFFQIMRSTF